MLVLGNSYTSRRYFRSVGMQHKSVVHVSVFEIVGSGHSRKLLGLNVKMYPHFHTEIEMQLCFVVLFFASRLPTVVCGWKLSQQLDHLRYYHIFLN